MSKNKPEDILETALLEKSEFGKTSPLSSEIEALVNIAHSFSTLPKKVVPQPTLQRKFVLIPQKLGFFARAVAFRFALFSLVAFVVLGGAVGTGYAAYGSLPGEALYQVKKSAEQLQLKFTSSEEAKATLQVKFSKKRLLEAQKVLNNPDSEPKKEEAVIKELIDQNKSTSEAVETVVKNSTSEKASSILSSLENISEKQKELFADIKPNSTAPIIEQAEKATAETDAKVAEIKKIIEDSKTEVSNEQTPLVQGTSTSTASSDPEISATSSNLSVKKPKVEAPEETPILQVPEITGGFILEDPNPQFRP